jgi:hypothetical protein
MPISPVPQIIQFQNKLVLILGAGASIQLYSDPTGLITNIAASPTGAVQNAAGNTTTITTTTPHGLVTGQQAVITNVTDATFNGVFQITFLTPTTFTYNNTASAPNATSGSGTVTPSVIPLSNTFVAAYTLWAASTIFSAGDIMQPTAANGFYYTAIQGGVTGTTEPLEPIVIGQQVKDGTVIWSCTAATQGAAPAPPGAEHGIVYSGALWVLNTSLTNTASGLDGPCSLRMSNINNVTSWNPINQAFLDKDDGTIGMGLATFTISAEGIPPEGTLIAFKNFATYQIIGVFGATNFGIQRVKTDMGCIAPRSIQFIPGFGVCRLAHLGIAIFDGVNDRIISEPIRPYLFPSSSTSDTDITVMDSQNIYLCQSAQTASPPMYVLAVPIGNSGGALTRIFCYDLVLKAWAIVDLPFPISAMTQTRTPGSTPITVFGGFSDGVIQRWQAGDILWYTGDSAANLPVNWSFRTTSIASQDSGQRIYCRRVILRGVNEGATGKVTVIPRRGGVAQSTTTDTASSGKEFDLFFDVNLSGLRFDADISGAIQAEIFGLSYMIEPRPAGVPVKAV